MEYWIISVPDRIGDKNVFSSIKSNTVGLSDNFKLIMPPYKFGNIDDLMIFADESCKLIITIETIISSIVQNMDKMLDENEVLLNHLQVNGTLVKIFLRNFHWDYLKHPIGKTPQTIMKDINEQSLLIMEKMKIKLNEFNTLKTQVDKIEAKYKGSLLARDLSDFVTKDDILTDSKFLQTLLLLVPTLDIENWKNFYEHFWHGIVPGSSKLLFKDNDFGLFTVVVTKKSVEGFKALSLKSRIIVRKFEYNEDEIKEAKINELKSKMELTTNNRNLQFWLKKHYSLCFSMYVHIQILRVMSESILKYGLGSAYTVILIKPKCIKHHEKIRSVLDNLLGCLEEQHEIEEFEEHYLKHMTTGGNKEYYPYVSSTIHVTGIQIKTNIQLLESMAKQCIN